MQDTRIVYTITDVEVLNTIAFIQQELKLETSWWHTGQADQGSRQDAARRILEMDLISFIIVLLCVRIILKR